VNRLQEYLLRAGRELGIRVIVPFELELDSGTLSADALLPDLGNPKGTIVSHTYEDLHPFGNELGKLGYGVSVYGVPPPTEEYDVESYKEMFKEWGWASDEKRRPEWMRV
jgi:hypothetical protein